VSAYDVVEVIRLKYMSISEASNKWNLSARRIRVLCSKGRIAGAVQIGRNWSIPYDAVKPADARVRHRKPYQGIVYDFSTIEEMKKKIDSHRPFSKGLAHSLHEKLIIEWTYHSNAIEGNTLTLSETKVVLEGITIGGKSIVEHLEAINHREAILFLEEIIRHHAPLSEWNIKNIHAIILKEIDKQHAGRYRTENVVIGGAIHIPPKHYEISLLMQHLILAYQEEWQAYHPIVSATLLHGEFVKIHPFIDGNGRTARLLLNFELMRNGYPPIIIKKENRAQYYHALDHAHTTMDYEPFLAFVAQWVIESEQLWLSLIE
jgi:Fic family protein